MFPPEVRALGVGLAYAIANAIFGGSAEYVALGLKSIGHETAFYWYVTAMMVIAFLVSLRLPRQAQLPAPRPLTIDACLRSPDILLVDQRMPDRESRGFGAVRRSRLAQDAAHMIGNRVGADEQLARDLPVSLSRRPRGAAPAPPGCSARPGSAESSLWRSSCGRLRHGPPRRACRVLRPPPRPHRAGPARHRDRLTHPLPAAPARSPGTHARRQDARAGPCSSTRPP